MNLSRTPGFLDWSVGAGRPFGIPVRLHVTILFFLWPAFAGWRSGPGIALEWAAGIVLSILLHELGHAMTAKRFGLTGLSITLHGFGGFASSSAARSPRQSLLISLAGPAVTFAIGLLGLAVGKAGMDAAAGEAAVRQFALFWSLGKLNILLGFLNMIPCLPWDGGQSLTAVLAHRISERKANRAVAHLGLILCPTLFVYGLYARLDFYGLFSLVGFMTSYSLLVNSGGVRFGEFLDDRRHRREMDEVRRREVAKADANRDQLGDRRREREERDRLRRLFEESGIDDR